jgi:uncharacterized membrane protein YdfJ with MMPL/SSD domain
VSQRKRRPRESLAAAIGGWSARHRKTAVFGWLLLVALAVVIGGMAGKVDLTNAEEGAGQSAHADQILDDAGIREPAGETVLVQATDGTTKVTDPGFRAAVSDVARAVRGTGEVRNVRLPYTTGAVSKDRHSALVRFDMRGPSDDAADHVEPVLDAVAGVADDHGDLRVEEAGGASTDKYFDDAMGGDFQRAEWTAVPLALGILLIAFGALVAALLPVALALTAFLAAGGLTALTSHAVHTSDTANSVMLLVGLAVGVDYCMFYLCREREERAAGRDPQTALRIAAATSGRAVMVSGLTVMAAMGGLFFTGDATFESMGLATILVVLTAVTGSVTVLPALLSMLGDRVEKGRVPFLRRLKRRDGGSRVWEAILTRVLRRPGVSAAVAAGALVLLAAPVAGLHTAHLTLEQEAAGNKVAVVQAIKDINHAFPGGSDPAEVVVRADHVRSAPVTRAIAALRRQAVSSGASRGPVTVTVHARQNVAVVDVPLAGKGNDDASAKALHTLRTTVLPATLGTVDGVDQAVGGSTAASVDFGKELHDGVLPVFGFVLALAFVLMLLSFRSLTVAVTTVVLNLLSVGAAYGILAMVFQHGWGASLFGAQGVGAVQSWLPLFLFVILFGLSMDYHVFVVSRIKEAHERGLATRAAIFRGITTTAGVVTSAAVIMVAVFAVFGTLSMQTMKQMGVGLAVAVLIDATLIRAVLLPAVMALLGERNWYLPRWLGWLPDLTEPPAEPVLPRQVPQPEPDLV